MPSQEQLLAELEIRSLLARERYYRDSRQWKKFRDCYHPDASQTCIDISWITGTIDDFVDGSIKLAQGDGAASAHSTQPCEITVNRDKAFAVSIVRINIRLVIDNVEFDIISWGRQTSRLARVEFPSGPQWRMLTLGCIYERDTIAPTRPVDTSKWKIDLPEDARPSYKHLQWALTKIGYSIGNDLLGTDEVERTEKFMVENAEWLKS